MIQQKHSCQHIECYAIGIECCTVESQGMLYIGQHVIKCCRTTDLWTSHEHISHWFTTVILVICRTLNMSWIQLLVLHCRLSYLQNFGHVMNTSVIGSPLSCQSFTEFWTCHYISTAVMSTPLPCQLFLELWASQLRTELIFWERH